MASRKASPSPKGSSPPPPPTDRREGRSHRQPSYYNQQGGSNRQSQRYDDRNPSNNNNGARRRRSYPPEHKQQQRPGSRQTIICVVYRGPSQGYHTAPVTFSPNRSTDAELWSDIRETFRQELQPPWRRLLLFTTLKLIRPIEFTRNDVPKRQDEKDVPGAHEFMHAYHHPQRLRTQHAWVDWFVQFRQDPEKSYGLEFVEGLWADKIAVVAIIFTVAIVVVSIVWYVLGGNLQTVFTVMGFVLTIVAAEIALIALYYQVSAPS